MKTDGRVKVGSSWASVPSIGAKMAIDICEAFKPSLPSATRRRRHFLQKDLDEAERKAIKAGKEPEIRVVLKNPAVDLHVAPKAVDTTESGYRLSADLRFVGTDDGADPHEPLRKKLAKKSAELPIDLSQAKRDDFFAVTIGGLEFGANNEAVKLFHQALKLPNELSVEKLEGWVKDPKESLRRGELGRTLEKTAHEMSPQKVEGWVKKPGESLARSELGRAAKRLFGW